MSFWNDILDQLTFSNAEVQSLFLSLFLVFTVSAFEFRKSKSVTLIHRLRNLGFKAMNVAVTVAVVSLIFVRFYPYLPDIHMRDLFWAWIPGWMQIPVGLLILDSIIFCYHRLSHAIPFVWRFHRMHHTDPRPNGSTAVRFHPMEVFFSMSLTFPLGVILDIPSSVSATYLILQPIVTIIHHADLDFGERWDRLMRLILVSPRMHHVHHSQNPLLMNRNFGNLFPFWDRIFGSYVTTPETQPVRYGLKGFSESRWQTVGGMLAVPFK